MTGNRLAFLFILALLIGASAAAGLSGTAELVTNGGFESDLEGWRLYVYDQTYGRVNETSGTSHSGTWSLRTYVNPVRAIPYTQKRGGGVTQELSPSVEDLNMTLSFWVMPAIVGENGYTNIRSVIHMELKDGRSLNLSYYVAWAPSALGEFLYNTSDNTIFFLPALLHQWSHIERQIKDDFESRYGSADGVLLSMLTVSFELTTVSHLTTPDAFWDDVDVIAEAEPTTVTPPADTGAPTPAPPPRTAIPPTSVSPKTPSQEEGGENNSFGERYGFPLVLVAAIAIGFTLVARAARSRNRIKTEVAVRYCTICGARIAVENEYCTSCGAKQ